MKKLLVFTLALMMTLSLVACGSKAITAPTNSAAQASVGLNAPKAGTQRLTATLDYEAIAAWVYVGYIGLDESGAPVVMAIDATNDMAIIILGDNKDMTATSFLGAITFIDTIGTITDEKNQSILTFAITEISGDTIELDMAHIGKATVQMASKEEVLQTIKIAINNYKHTV